MTGVREAADGGHVRAPLFEAIDLDVAHSGRSEATAGTSPRVWPWALTALECNGVGGAVAMVLGLVMSADADVIQWTAPPSCPDDAAVEERIAAFVDVETEASPTIATVVESETGFEVELVSTIDGEVQRRTLQAATCETLADAVAAVIAVTIDPSTTPTSTSTSTTTTTPAKPPEAPPAEDAETRGVLAAPPVADLSARTPLQIGLRVGGGWAGSIVPSGSGVVGVGTSIGRTRWAVELEGRLWIPRQIDVSGEDFGATVTMGTVLVAACARPATRVVEVPLCGGLEGGAMRAAPRNLEGDNPQTFPWAAPFVRVGLRLRLREVVGLLLAAEGAVPIVRAQIQIDGAEPFRRTQPVSVRVLAGLDFRWVR